MHSQTTRILLADSEAEAHVLSAVLHKVPRFRFELADERDLASAVRRCQTERFDVLVLGLPAEGLTNAVAQVRELAPYLPVVVHCDRDDDALATQVLARGAQDFLVKGDADGYALRRALSGAVQRNRSALAQELTGRILDCLNRPGPPDRMAADVTSLVKHYLGAEAVGIRVRDGKDFPYFVTRGFPEQFVRDESSLCTLGRDPSEPVCLCGAVLEGRTDSEKAYFTEAGSFWTGDLRAVLPELRRSQPGLRMRGRCQAEGYRSVALIPLRCGENTMGLLQANDSRPNSFSAALVRVLERIAVSVGLAFRRVQVERELRAERDFMDAVLETAGALVIVMDPDGRVERFNRACESATGYTREQVVGKVLWDLLLPADEVAGVRQVFENLRAGLFPNRYENDWRTRDGQRVRVAWSNTCLTDADGQVAHVIGTGLPVPADADPPAAGRYLGQPAAHRAPHSPR